ncbi:Uncharacterised protein [Serratia entomophila]|nr:Uncharacterised protein [Serratia entomophila]CAI2153501.1 Uncharacterised protein [Serratia entomophila]
MAGAGHDQLQVRRRIETGDVFRYRAREQLVVLQHAGDALPVVVDADVVDIQPVDEQRTAARLQQAAHQLHQRGLAYPRRADDRHAFPRRYLQVDAGNHRLRQAVVLVIQVAHVERRRFVGRIQLPRRHLFLRLRQHDVRHPLVVQAQHAQPQHHVDQVGGAVGELPAVGVERHEHPQRHLVVDHQRGAQPQNDDLIAGADQRVDAAEHHVQFGQADVGVGGVDIQVQPVLRAGARQAQRFQGADAVQRFHKVRAGLGALDQLLFRRLTIVAVGGKAQHHVNHREAHHHPHQPAAVQQHHDEHADRHDAVDDAVDDAGGERGADGVQRAETRLDIPQLALFEIGQRQLHQVVEQPGLPLHVDKRAHHDAGPGAQHRHAGAKQNEEQQPDADQRQQIVIAGLYHVVHHQLGADRHQQVDGLNHQRQAEDFDQRAFQAADVAQQGADMQLALLRDRGELAARPQLQRHAGKMQRQLLQAYHPAAEGRVVNDDAAAAHPDQHHEVVHVPVQDAGGLQLLDFIDAEGQRAGFQRQGGGDVDQRRQGGAA